MSQENITVVVAGASGKLGALVCKHLLDNPSVTVKALGRQSPSSSNTPPSSLAPLFSQHPNHKNIHFVAVDYASESQIRETVTGAYCIVSCLQGLEDVLVGVQSMLLKCAIQAKVRRFIPSDYAADFTKEPQGWNRNFDIHRQFHVVASKMIREQHAEEDYKIEFTAIMQGAFMEMVVEKDFRLIDWENHMITYIGDDDNLMDLTTWDNTAEFTARVATDPNPTPSHLTISGDQVSAKDIQRIASEVAGVPFGIKKSLSTWFLWTLITIIKTLIPGKKGDTLPLWQKLMYGYSMAKGRCFNTFTDNHIYKDIKWTSVHSILESNFQDAQK